MTSFEELVLEQVKKNIILRHFPLVAADLPQQEKEAYGKLLTALFSAFARCGSLHLLDTLKDQLWRDTTFEGEIGKHLRNFVMRVDVLSAMD
eukprot:CAMPEP_0184530660 /NCGR_PEP_ID=MMETSP0198_2-20121128/13078_1 /TAXON_ID=1112570 /ORGANISM="Thraustochytrium sp., Strain LLF1b" /LENGTH=91 /DNA_ID=CAMNT_0026922857 /DNA_START=5 /DNA_END=277 /DNA_ORIENTATION=+